MCFRTFVGIVIGCVGTFTPGAFLLATQTLFVTYIIWAKPYVNTLLLVRAIFNELAVFTVFLVATLYTYTYTGQQSGNEAPSIV